VSGHLLLDETMEGRAMLASTATRSPLHRHQLAWLTPAGWARILSRPWDPAARECLAHWAEHRLPLVVTRQLAAQGEADWIALGLPAPGRWERRRIALRVPREDVLYFDEFPRADKLLRRLQGATRDKWQRLCAGLAACGVNARIYGSHGWQLISGLDHVRRGSDIDVWIAVSSFEQADAVAALLQSFSSRKFRLDGELVFEGGDAIAWREWLAWREGRVQALLIKTIGGASVSRSFGPRRVCESMEALG
jgi:phosphoribosyl-dephospho-CoA transferase